MSTNDVNEEKFQQLMGRLSDDDMQSAASVIQTTMIDASAIASAKNKGIPQDQVPKQFTENVQWMYDALLKNLNANDKKVFKAAVERAKMNGSQQPELAESIYGQ